MKLSTTTKGSGPRVAALVHGASASSDIWRDFAAILIEKYDLTVIFVDLRGHGDSPRADRYLVEDFANDLVDTLPVGLDFVIGQSLGGLSSAEAVDRLLPKRFIGLDPAFDISPANGWALRILGPIQPHFPNWLQHALKYPPDGSAPDTLERRRADWKKWDPRMMKQLQQTFTPFVVRPPSVPSTLVLADPSFAVPPKIADALRAAGWNIRIKPGGVHDLHVQDPVGLAALLDDVLVATT